MRRTIKIEDGWFFTYQNKERTPVDIPHTWNGKDGQDGGNDYWRGTNQYDVKFDAPEFDEKEEQVYLQFHGVNASAGVILNDEFLCTHNGGYSTFRMDITEKLQSRGNHLVVEVDNSVNDNVYPQKADFTFYGGIYREVELLIVNRDHFELDYYGGSGMKYTAEVTGKDAVVYVKTYTKSQADVRISLFDADHKLIADREGAHAEIQIRNVQLWEGVKKPYLYQLRASLYKNGKIVDEIGCSCGIRTFAFDPDKGFFLNGKPYPLHGVSRHQDFKDIGNAITKEHHDRDMELIREVGANTIRLAHYQHDQYFYDLCDQYGMIVWAEIPYISEHLPNGRENTFSQMKELIVQNYNHPSIVTWGLSNEITISGKQHKKDMLDNHYKLQELVKKMDSTRPTTLACFAMCPPWHPVAHISDIVAWNLYLGWYVPGLFLNDGWLKLWRILYPKRCLGFSEYGAEGMPNLHSSMPKRGDNTEEYQAIYHEYMLKCFERHPFMWGTYVWNMFDFAADAREQGGEPGMNHKGLVTFDRSIKKDSFYLYKAYWTREPFVHLRGKRYEYRPDSITDITVYSTLKEVSLYNNDKLIETKKGDKVFKFHMAMETKNHIEVKAGACMDCAVIYKTDKPKSEYKMKKGDSSNWM